MKVFMGNSPWRKGDIFGIRAGSRWPHTTKGGKLQKIPDYIPFPFLLAYAAALLKKNKIELLLVDAIAEGLNDDQFIKSVKSYSPNLVLLETSTPSIFIDLAMAKRLREELENQACIALCGPHVTIFPRETLQDNPFIDYILMGEYEYTLLDLVNHLRKGQNLQDVLGVAYRQKGDIQINPRRPLIENLDELPWPARHLLPMYNYNDSFCHIPTPSLQMWTSRGCPYHCIFCMWPKVMYGGYRYRVRNPINVVDEMEWSIKEYGFKSVYFDDDTVNIGKPRMLKLADEIKKRNLGVLWAIMARADTIDRETLEVMADAGLCAVKYGVESGVQELINASGKNLRLDKVKEAVKLSKGLGIRVHLTFTFGLPGETKETIKKTLEFAEEMDPDSIQFSLCTPLPGTEYFEMAKHQGFLLSQNWSEFDGCNTAVVRTEHLTKVDLEQALKQAEKFWTRHRIKKALQQKELLLRFIRQGVSHPLKTLQYFRH